MASSLLTSQTLRTNTIRSFLMDGSLRFSSLILYALSALVFEASSALLPVVSHAAFLPAPTQTQSRSWADPAIPLLPETPCDAAVRVSAPGGGHLEWGRPDTRFSASVSETFDTQSTLSQQRVAVAWALPQRSMVQLAYIRRTLKEAALQPLATSQSQALESAVGYRLAGLSLQARSVYTQHQQSLGAIGTSHRQEHWLTASYDVWTTLTLSSQFGWEEQAMVRTPSTSLVLSYQPVSTIGWKISSRYRTIDGMPDGTKVDTTCLLSWQYYERRQFAATLSLEQTYTAALTSTIPDAFGTLVQLRLAGDQWVEGLRAWIHL